MKAISRICLLLSFGAMFSCANDDTVAPTVEGSQPDSDYSTQLGEYLTIHPAVKGAMAKVSTDSETLWEGSDGLADVGTGRKMDVSQPFLIASLTKPMVAAVVLQIHEEGLIHVDSLLVDYVDDEVVDLLPHIGEVTVRQLLNHTSGIFDYLEGGELHLAALATPEQRYSFQDRIGVAVEYGTPYFSPGEGYAYSNTNYVLLGLLVESVSGRSLKQELETRIFDRLGMTATVYAPSDMPSDMVHGYYIEDDITQFIFNFDWNSPDGGVVSTMSDLETFFFALLKGQFFEQEATLQAMLDMSTNSYGLGMELFAEGENGRIYGHTGSTPGYNCVVAYIEQQDKLILVMNNQTETEIPNNAFLMNELILLQE
jgi:D-alanyl-D-alanine carboxypeptidase